MPQPPSAGGTRPGFIVLLNGCSSAGKTSLARALIAAAPELHLIHVSLDVFRGMEPSGYWSPDQRDEWPLRIAALCHAINAATSAYTRHGQNVVLDHVLSADAWRYLELDLGNELVYLIRVECPLDVMEKREAQRADREAGLARSQMGSVHLGRDYDFVVDTSKVDPGGAAELVLGHIRRRPEPPALAGRLAGFQARADSASRFSAELQSQLLHAPSQSRDDHPEE